MHVFVQGAFNMMLGAFHFQYFWDAQDGLWLPAVVLFMLFMLVVPTVMLNALIALMVRMTISHPPMSFALKLRPMFAGGCIYHCPG